MINIGFTWHREDKISNDKDRIFSVRSYLHAFLDIVLDPFRRGGVHIHLGGANGFDNWVGKWCIFNNVPYTLHLPFQAENKERIEAWMTYKEFEEVFSVQIKGWKRRQKKELYEILHNENANVNTDYTGFHSRDRGIVDASDTVFSGYLGGGVNSGTGYTMKYALDQEKRVINVFDPFVKVTDKYMSDTTNIGFDFLHTIETVIPKECQHSHE